MDKVSKLPIGFRINDIETLQFAIFEEHLSDGELSYTAGFAFGVDVEAKIIRSIFKYELKREKNLILILETAIDFLIEEQGFQSFINSNKQMVLPHSFAAHLATLVVGTARGILFEKTKSTPFAKLHLPTINVTTSVSEDLIFALD